MSLEYSVQQLRSGLSLAIVANVIWGVAALFWVETRPVDAVDVVAHRAIWTLPIATLILFSPAGCGRRGLSCALAARFSGV